MPRWVRERWDPLLGRTNHMCGDDYCFLLSGKLGAPKFLHDLVRKLCFWPYVYELAGVAFCALQTRNSPVPKAACREQPVLRCTRPIPKPVYSAQPLQTRTSLVPESVCRHQQNPTVIEWHQPCT